MVAAGTSYTFTAISKKIKHATIAATQVDRCFNVFFEVDLVTLVSSLFDTRRLVE